MHKISYSILIIAFAGFFWSGCLESIIGEELTDVVCGGLASCLNGVGKSIPFDEYDVTCVCECNKGFCGDRCEKEKKCPDGYFLPPYSCDCYPVGVPGDVSALPGKTSKITFENLSVSQVTYDILLDGEWLSSLAPSGKSDLLEVNAGKHHLEFRISGSTSPACINEEIYLQPGQSKRFVCNT